MADTKITALTALTGADPANDVIPIVDVSDTTMAASGTTKKISVNNILGASGTATLASATITGDLTVATNTLKTTSGNVGIGTVTPDIFSRFYTRTIGFNSSGSTVMQINGSSYSGIDLGAGGTRTFGIASSATDASLTTLTNIPIVFGINGSTAMTLNSTGLGVGGSPSYKLSSIGTTNNQVVLHVGNTAGTVDGDTTNVVRFAAGSGANALWANARYDGFSHAWRCNSTTTEAMVLNSSGNVGIGVTPSATWASNRRALQIGGLASGAVALNGTGGSGEIFFNSFFNTSTQNICVVTGGTGKYDFNVSTVGAHSWSVGTGTAGNAFTFTQAMTLDASGNLLVGTTTTSGNAGGLKLSNVGGTLGQITFSNNSGVADYVARFNYGSTPTLVGTITVASGGTTYNTTSDYRLKESVQPLVGGLARVSALKPSIYKWKSDGSSGEGFLAHELAEVVPFAVTGEKDAVNEDGSVKAQGVDLSRVVPILVAAIQELAAEVNALKNA